MKYKLLISCFLVTLIFCASVISLGVSTLYYIGHPLEMYPGQFFEFQIVVTNEMNTPISLKGDIVQGDDIAYIVNKKDIYNIPENESFYPIKISAYIPSNTTIGKEYIIKINFEQVNIASNNDMISMGIGIIRDIPVKVVKKPINFPKERLILLAIIVFIVLVVFINKKESPKDIKKK